MKSTSGRYHHDSDTTRRLPVQLVSVVEQIFVERVEIGEQVDYAFLENLLHQVVAVWNQNLDYIKDFIQTREYLDHDRKEDILAEMKPIAISTSARAKHTQGMRLARRLGIKAQVNAKPMKHLKCEHPEMAAVRQWVSESEKLHGINPRTTIEESIQADVWALRSLQQYKKGKLIHYAWLTRGLVSIENLADWVFNGRVEDVKEHMKLTKHEFNKLLELDSIPENNYDAERLHHMFLKDKKLAGEVTMTWCITVEDQCMPLPDWMQVPIFVTASEWRYGLDKWMQRKDRHTQRTGKDKLPPKLQLDFEKFQQNSMDIKIYLNKSTHIQLLKSDSKAMKAQRDHLILLRVGFSEDTSQITLRSGNQPPYPLKLMSGDLIAEEDAAEDCDASESDDDKTNEFIEEHGWIFDQSDVETESESDVEMEDEPEEKHTKKRLALLRERAEYKELDEKNLLDSVMGSDAAGPYAIEVDLGKLD
eukprot:s3048_g22.t1